MGHHGVDYKRRREQAREHVLAMRELWEHDEAEFHGTFVDFSPSWCWPKPTQAPLPILVGGAEGPKLFAHIAEYAQGWIPIGGRGLRDAIPRLQDAMREAGRTDADIEAMRVVPMAVQPDAGKLEHYASIGVTEVVFDLPAKPADTVLPILDRYAELVASLAQST
jgi:alkanesulfonate monooxygenase SsuD/methylene tetrahydromethanopterin reductase-like flavin-dependent oxidoreductase (luciferase family)